MPTYTHLEANKTCMSYTWYRPRRSTVTVTGCARVADCQRVAGLLSVMAEAGKALPLQLAATQGVSPGTQKLQIGGRVCCSAGIGVLGVRRAA